MSWAALAAASGPAAAAHSPLAAWQRNPAAPAASAGAWPWPADGLPGSQGQRAGGCQLTPLRDPRTGLRQDAARPPRAAALHPQVTPALTSHCSTGPLDCTGVCLPFSPPMQPGLVERCLSPSRMQWDGGHASCLATAQLASYLALLCVVTLVAFGALPAVRELIVEQPFPIHLQREVGSQRQSFPTAKPPLPQHPRCSPAGSQGEQSRCRYSTP